MSLEGKIIGNFASDGMLAFNKRLPTLRIPLSSTNGLWGRSAFDLAHRLVDELLEVDEASS